MVLVQHKRLLIVSYYFPPMREARALQLGKLIKYLSRQGVEGDVVCSTTTNEPDDSLSDNDLMGFGIHRVDFPETNKHKLADRLSTALLGVPVYLWAEKAKRKVLELLYGNGPHRYGWVLTCSQPLSSHLVGLFVRKLSPDLPWLAHFSDPVGHNPFLNHYNFPARMNMQRLEKLIVKRADRLLFVGGTLKDFFMRPYPYEAEKANVLPHVFDPELYTGTSFVDDGVLSLAYVGGFSKVRTFAPLVDLVHLLQAKSAPMHRLRIHLVGKRMAQAAAALNAIVPNLAVDAGEVPYQKSLEIMQQSGGLLVIDADLSISPFFPSKLADYLGSARPIVGISPRGSGSSAVLNGLDLPVFDYRHFDDLSSLLVQVLTGQRTLPVPDEILSQKFSAVQVATQFVQLLGELAK